MGVRESLGLLLVPEPMTMMRHCLWDHTVSQVKGVCRCDLFPDRLTVRYSERMMEDTVHPLQTCKGRRARPGRTPHAVAGVELEQTTCKMGEQPLGTGTNSPTTAQNWILPTAV